MYSMNASEKNTQSIRVNILPSYLHMADEPTFYLSQYDKGLYLYKVLLYEKNRKFNIDDLEDKPEEEDDPTPTPTPDEGGENEEGGDSGDNSGENDGENNGENNEGNTEEGTENGENNETPTEPIVEPDTEPTEPTENTDNTGGESEDNTEEPIVGDGEDDTTEPTNTDTPTDDPVVPGDNPSDTPSEGEDEGGESGDGGGSDPSDEPTPEPEPTPDPTPEPEPSHIHVYIQGIKPDNKAFRYECTFNKNVVYLPEQKQITNVPGIVTCTVIIVKDGLRKTSEPFYLKIEKSLIQDISNISKDEVVKLDGDEEAEYIEPTSKEDNGEIIPSDDTNETTDDTGETGEIIPGNTEITEP